MKTETKALIAFLVAGIIAGILSWIVGKMMPGNDSNFIALTIAIVILALLPKILKGVLKVNEKFKWWLANGGWIYIFVWFITWIIFYNVW